MKLNRFSRRRFLLTLGAAFALGFGHCRRGREMARTGQKGKTAAISASAMVSNARTALFISSTCITKGDRAYAESVVKTVKAPSPDFAWFQGRHHGRRPVYFGQEAP